MWPYKRATLSSQQNIEARAYSLNDFDSTFFYIKRVFMVLGLRIGPEDPRFKTFWNIFYLFVFISILLPIILNSCQLIIVLESGDFDGVLDSFRIIPCIGCLALALLKTYKVVYERPVFDNLLSVLRSMWPQGVISEEEDEVINKALKKVNGFSKAYYYCNLVVVIVIVVPWCSDVVRRIFGEEIPRVLPYDYWMPYDPSRPVLFEITLIMQFSQSVFTAYSLVAGDLLFCVFLSHITIQLDLMSLKIQRLFDVSVDQQLLDHFPLGKQYNRAKDTGRYTYLTAKEQEIHQEKQLYKILERHRVLISLAADIEKLFSFSLLINFIYSSFVICFCGFCSVVIEKWNVFVFKTFLICGLSQTWLLWWSGDRLLEASTGVGVALYNSGWYTASGRIKKCILFMIYRSEKSLHVTTYGFSKLSLSSYAVIIKSTWSYFTLLLNFFNK
uniref:Odorant receptor n=1 Tax=Glyphodes pyloalis TaxID=1242752 RepID=A0A6M3GS22_GLYPY|nr:olfactory receptor [Glyphodes pyloalis]